jgi:hypothetical protein
MSREANRLEIMRQAGVTDKLVPLVKKAVARLEEELDAKTTKFFAHEGEVVEERSVIDHTARQGAIDKTFVLADVLRPRSDQNNGPGNVTVNLIWPGWSSPPPAIDVKAEVVEPASE